MAYNPTPDGLGPLEWFDKIAARAEKNVSEASQRKRFKVWDLVVAILGRFLSANAVYQSFEEPQTQEG
jgi:hypothetical protein